MKKLICLGDSITDCGRFFSRNLLGEGYVYFLSEKLNETGINYQVKNCGIDGFTISALLRNAQNYLAQDADIITVLIGINDIGLMMNTNRTPQQQIQMMADFSGHYEELLDILEKPGCEILLAEPFIFPWPMEYQNWLPHVKTMSHEIQKLADRHHMKFIGLHELLNKEAQRYGNNAVTTDGIHLTPLGHEILCRELYAQICTL